MPAAALHAIIMGAGPAGLAAALALRQQSTPAAPIRVTVLELRPAVQTLGGAVNLTPLALRYLDALGAGPRLRPRAARVPHIDMLSHRTGASLGRLWPDVDAVRVLRRDLVESLVQTAREAVVAPDDGGEGGGGGGGGGGIELRYGVRVSRIEERGDADSPDGCVVVHFVDTTTTTPGTATTEQTLQGDLLLGCDGIHSFVRSTLVDPGRSKTYSGRATAYGFIPVAAPGDAGIATADGSPAVAVSSLVTAQLGSLLVTFFEPARERLYLAAVVAQAEPGAAAEAGGRDGRRATGEDREALKRDFLRRFRGGGLVGLEEVVERCDEWVSFPVYMLPPGGTWRKGRALLLGDAAHAMPPQGESTGVAIEDAVLLARVVSRRETRSVGQMLGDYEALRRPVIDKTYDEAVFRWRQVGDKSWLGTVAMEWFSAAYIWAMNRWSSDSFGRDVRTLELPA